jgi:hypothetical protein
MLSLSINGTTPPICNSDWTTPTNPSLKEAHVSSLSGSSPVTKWTIDAGTDGLHKEELDDILLLLKYTISVVRN